jgi:hypothetical protein
MQGTESVAGRACRFWVSLSRMREAPGGAHARPALVVQTFRSATCGPGRPEGLHYSDNSIELSARYRSAPITTQLRLLLALALSALTCACARQGDVPFRVDNARAHLERLAGAIGSRPVGTEANTRARAYLVDQLRLFGFHVRVQEVDAARPEHGRTARVANVVAIRPGRRSDAVALVAHYDTRPEAPGAMDDGLGTAVALEAGRILGARTNPRYSLAIILTDGEEVGLMGAAGIVQDAELRARIKAYLNLESIGGSGQSILFESGPRNETLVRAWAQAAPRPRGSSYAVEIYKRLPNDTDFTILSGLPIPGLNFAPVGDSHAYHTSRDLPERVTPEALNHMGQTAVAVVQQLDAVELGTGGRDVRFSDVASRGVVILASWQGRLLAVLAVAACLVSWVRMVRRLFGWGTWPAIASLIWGVLCTAAAVGAMLGAVWLLRAAREVYHPWYAHPLRLLALVAISGIVASWYLARLALLLPPSARYVRAPETVWALVLIPWAALAAAAEWFAPAAAHLWSIPVLAAGLLLALAPAGRTWILRIFSAIIFLVTALFFLRDGIELFAFLVAVFGRLPLVTPAWIYPVFVALLGLMLAPPLTAALIGLVRRGWSHGVIGAMLLAALAVAMGLAYAADAYTTRNPLRRYAQYVSDQRTGAAFWEIRGNEPGLDVDASPADAARWRPVPREGSIPIRVSIPIPRQGGAFGFYREAEATPPPADVSARTISSGTTTVEYEVGVMPRQDGLAATLVMPPGVVPVGATPSGVIEEGRWYSTFIAVPAGGIAFRATLAASAAPTLSEALVVITSARLPGGEGTRPLPWMPRTVTDWSPLANWIVTPQEAPVVPVEPATVPASPPPGR